MDARLFPSVALAVALGLATGCDDGSVDASTPPAACPDPAAAAAHVESLLATYDYQGSASPSELAAGAAAVLVGTVADAGTDAGWHRVDLEDVTAVAGPRTGHRVRILVDEQFGRATLEPTLMTGLTALAVVHDQPSVEGGRVVAIEGLWFACSHDDAAAKLAPTRDGWPLEPTIERIAQLVVDPPTLIDGPLVRRSGIRALPTTEMLPGAAAAEVTGALVVRDECLAVEREADAHPIVWPAGTAWRADGPGITTDDGTTIAVGSVISVRGAKIPVFFVRYEIGADAGAALDRCAPDPNAPVLVADEVSVTAA